MAVFLGRAERAHLHEGVRVGCEIRTAEAGARYHDDVDVSHRGEGGGSRGR